MSRFKGGGLPIISGLEYKFWRSWLTAAYTIHLHKIQVRRACHPVIVV